MIRSLFTLFLLLLLIVPMLSVAVDSSTNLVLQEEYSVPQVDLAVELTNLQQNLDKIKNQVSGGVNENQLDQLNEKALTLLDNSESLIQTIDTQRQQLDAQLTVLGPEPIPDNGGRESAEVTRKRTILDNKKRKLDAQIKQADGIRNGTLVLSSQIANQRRDLLKNKLAFNSGSVFGTRFWSPLISPQDLDRQKVSNFAIELHSSIAQSWEPGWRLSSACWLVGALLVIMIGRRYSEEFLAWISIRKIPKGRLRRSFLAVAIVLTTLFTIVLSFNFMALAFIRTDGTSPDVLDFVKRLIQLSFYCGLIAGLGRAFLSIRRPSWRLFGISDELALALKPFPAITAALVFIFQAAEYLSYTVGTSINITILANGINALLIGITGLAISLRTSRVRKHILLQGSLPTARSTIVVLLQLLLTISSISILALLIIGYVSLARFLSYEVIWCGILIGSFYFLRHLIRDGCETLFSINNTIGKRMQTALNIKERHLQLVATLFNAIGQILLVGFITLAVLNGTFSTSTPIDLIQKVIKFWGGKGLESINIVPARLVNALMCLAVGIYVLRLTRSWLDKELLPKTSMDIGMRVSLVTLFSNIGYVLTILLTLSIMGVQWNKLAWIVSALSVGIGFGLQEIVKNFISGLILLTERPVKVGDLVSISGIEGDIRRINVRATEIQLSDKSTVIVPNSQLISQNVRNATMGNAHGVVTIQLTFPLDIDPSHVREILLQAYQENERILETFNPTVSFKELTPNGIVLSVTGNVVSQRQISGAKSELLFGILTRLRNENIVLSTPQTMIIERRSIAVDRHVQDDQPI